MSDPTPPPKRQRTAVRPTAPSPAFQIPDTAVAAMSTVVVALAAAGIGDPPKARPAKVAKPPVWDAAGTPIKPGDVVLERLSGRILVTGNAKVIEPARPVTVTFPETFFVGALAGKKFSALVFAERDGVDYPYWIDFAVEGQWRMAFAKKEWIS